MKVTAWKNGRFNTQGLSFGLKVTANDRDRHFRRIWKSVFIRLPNGLDIEVNIDKASFWNNTCRELISKEIGDWLHEYGHAPWPLGKPPTFELYSQGERNFILNE